MGLFDFLKKPKTDLEEYYEQRAEREQFQPNEFGTGSFAFAVQDVCSITGRGTVVTGQVLEGCIRVGEDVVIERMNGSTAVVKVTGIEAFRKMLNEAVAGQNVGILLRGVDRNDVSSGDKLKKY